MAELKKNWTLNQDAFRRFLTWLDAGVDSGGESYLEMRRRLVLYFDRKDCANPDELADETLNRVARKLEEKGEITDVSPAHYCYIAAKFVFLEAVRSPDRRQSDVDGLTPAQHAASALAVPPSSDGAVEAQEKRIVCLESCLQKLQAGDKDLILEYYQGEQRTKIENRGHLAEKLGLTTNALTIRACRIRSRLEVCTKTCSETA